MPTKIHKKDLELAIKKANILEAAVEKIERLSSKPTKTSLSAKFHRYADKLIDDERDILLIVVKLK